jgi:hypothetical protein
MNNSAFKESIKDIIRKNDSELASEKLIELFNKNKRYRLHYLDEKKEEKETHIWAKNQDEAFNELEKICPKATYIFIDKI